MSIRGSFQNIRDQIGKINTILDGSKSSSDNGSTDQQDGAAAEHHPSAEHDHRAENGFVHPGEPDFDRGPVAHTSASEPRSIAENLYQPEYQDEDRDEPVRQHPNDRALRTDTANDDGVEYSNGNSSAQADDYPASDPDQDVSFDYPESFEMAKEGFVNADHEIEELVEPGLEHDHSFEMPEADSYIEEFSDPSPHDSGHVVDELSEVDRIVERLDETAHYSDDLNESGSVQLVDPGGVRISDRVVERLLQKALVTEKQVMESWEEWTSLKEDGYSLSLWRVMTLHPDLKREVIFEEAALVYAFQKATTSLSDAIAFIEKAVPVFEGDRLDRMLDLFVIPVAKEKDTRTGDVKWLFVTHDPTRPEAHKLLRDLGIKRFELRYWSEAIIEDVITAGVLTKNVYLDRLNDDPMVYDLGTNFDKDKKELVDEEELENEINRSSLINLFEASLVEAVNKGASDIHIFPNPLSQIEIHFRIDGHLELWHKEERISAEAFLAVVKDKSQNVDRFEKDTAQDGFIQRPISDTTIRFRVSILPIASHKPGATAESIVIRVLDDRKVLSDLRKVGMLDQAMKRFEQAIHQPHGMVILTGPTGSGKSTTLVAALHQVITPKLNVLTIEDPVEYLIKGIRQVKLSHHLTMEGALRALLRHDPDVVMVGEMRDQETAELAIKLANTGHLTFSTLHTNDAPSAVSRLYKMGIEPFLIAYAINIVVAQRLIRSLCPACKVVGGKDAELMRVLEFTDEEIETSTMYAAGDNSSCEKCHGVGYKGRRAVAETLYFSEAIRAQIIRSGDSIDEQALRDIASSEGMLSLQASAREIAKEGDTSLEEVVRITGQ